LVVCNLPAGADATSTTWTDPNTTGDWFTAANWSNGVPTCSLDAYINNGGGAAINSGATALSLTLGENTTDSG
jgi:hypothetical protein